MVSSMKIQLPYSLVIFAKMANFVELSRNMVGGYVIPSAIKFAQKVYEMEHYQRTLDITTL